LTLSPDPYGAAYRIGLAVVDWLNGAMASPNKSLAQSDKSISPTLSYEMTALLQGRHGFDEQIFGADKQNPGRGQSD